jgi:hypothetical protein
MYGQPVDHEALEWSWAEERLLAAPTYWVDAAGLDVPHPRAVWGVWVEDELLLSLGSPTLRSAVEREGRVVVHLDSGTDVVLVHGNAAADDDAAVVQRFLSAYDEKYDWRYDVAAYGPPTRVRPTLVLAWHAAGAAGRDGFVASAKWRFS